MGKIINFMQNNHLRFYEQEITKKKKKDWQNCLKEIKGLQ